jgi:fructose-bisphosphate aldolase class II
MRIATHGVRGDRSSISKRDSFEARHSVALFSILETPVPMTLALGCIIQGVLKARPIWLVGLLCAGAPAGFDAIVFDLSSLPFEQNARQTRAAVEALKGVNPNVLVEGELGDIGSGSEIHAQARNRPYNLTTAEEAKQYVESTRIDIFAPAVGNTHGMLASMVQGEVKKRLDIERIAQIKRAVRIPLTLHGGSGTDDHDLRSAIAAGISIIHINTELRIAWRRGLEEGLRKDPDGIVPYKILPLAVASVKQVTTSRLRLFNARQQAA